MKKEEIRKIGVWLLGAYGLISSCVVVGTLALAKRIAPTTGLITELDFFDGLPLLRWRDIVFGGTDIRNHSIYASLEELHRNSRVLPCEYMTMFTDEINAIEKNIHHGTTLNCGTAVEEIAHANHVRESSLENLITNFQETLNRFKSENDLADIIVVNLTSTEAYPEVKSENTTYDGIKESIENNRKDYLPASTIYAWAAIDAGYPYINFTPSAGSSWDGVKKLAEKRRVPHIGNDGKTGETLLKSVLAPMFLLKNLQVLSWEGYNILGNQDGKILSDPKNRESKIRSKGQTLDAILGYKPHSKVTIDMVPSLNDWKIAWDFIHFSGFLNTPMSMQFIWNGCDSLLAAPLVLDLIRLLEYAHREKEYGIQKHLSCFFKSPLDCSTLDFREQYDMLFAYLKTKKGTR